MTFIEPTIKEIYNTISNNDELIRYLKENEYLLTKAMLYDSYTVSQIREMETAILADNSETLYNLAEVLRKNSKVFREHDVWYLTSNLVAFDDVAAAFGLDRTSFSVDAYRLIVYTFKYCCVSSFFQNNKEIFLPEYDFNEIQSTPIMNGFLDAIMKEFDRLDCVIGKCLEYHDFDKIPYDLINYLTQLLGFEKATINADDEIEAKYREIVRNIIDIYRIKGTNFSFELLFKFLGYNITVDEFYFDRRYFYASSAGNPHTNITDKDSYLYYMSTEAPADNRLDITNGEEVDIYDYSPQYNLNEFNELARKYGPAAVLGYSKVDSSGNEYEGKVYKYFKSNLVYYTINLDKSNPNEKQLAQINKILSFLTPAYIMKTTNINVFTGANTDIPSENMIFFDDNRAFANTVEELENGVTTEAGYEYVREKIRNFPFMLDSEMRDDGVQPKRTNKDLYIDENGDILHDNNSKSPYVNTINTSTFKPKVDFKIGGKICLNRYASNNSYDFITIMKKVEKNSLFQDVLITDLPIDEYVDTQKLSMTKCAVETLTFLESANDIETLKNKYDCNLIVSDEFTSFPNFIAPIRLGEENLKRMELTKCVIVPSTGGKFAAYKFGAVPADNANYSKSFKVKLVKTHKLYRSKNKKININVPSELKVEKSDLEALYDAANSKDPAEAIKLYYYNSSENYWYMPIKKASLTQRIETINGKKKYLMVNSQILPLGSDETSAMAIPKLFRSEDGKFGMASNSTVYSTPEDCFKANGVKIYNNFMFYVEEIENDYESDLYKFSTVTANSLVYSKADKKLYKVSQNGYEKLDDFFGRLEIDGNDGRLYEYDESWYGYNEIDDFDNFIWYNNSHRIRWEYLGIDKTIGRPIKELTDADVNGELSEALTNEIFYSTFSHFPFADQEKILELGEYKVSGEFLLAIKGEEVPDEVKEYLREKSSSKDAYGNYNDVFRLLSDFVNSESSDEFLKYYYYDKLTKLYRESFFKDESGERFIFKFTESERMPLYEKLNGNLGKLRKPNTLLQSRVNDKSLNLKYSIKDGKVFVEKNELLRGSVLYYFKGKPYLKAIKNIKLNYGTRSLFIYNLKCELDSNNNLVMSCALPENITGGFLEVNNTVQHLSDNKINAHTSSYFSEGEFANNGDDRILDVKGKIDEVAEVVAIGEDLVFLMDKDMGISDLRAITIEYEEDLLKIDFEHIDDYAFVKIENTSTNKFTLAENMNDIDVGFSVSMENLSLVEK